MRIEFQSTMTISGVIMAILFPPAVMFIVQSHLIQKRWSLVHFRTRCLMASKFLYINRQKLKWITLLDLIYWLSPLTTEVWEFTTGDKKQINPILKNRHYEAGSGLYLVDIGYCQKLSSWSGWSTCSTSCGGGEMIRSRSCLRDCPSTDDLTQTQACNDQPCPGKNLLPIIKESSWGTPSWKFRLEHKREKFSVWKFRSP